MISLYFSSLSSVEFESVGSSKPSDFPFLGLLLDLLLHIFLVTLLRRSQSFGEAPRPSNAAPTHLRSQLFVRGRLMTLNILWVKNLDYLGFGPHGPLACWECLCPIMHDGVTIIGNTMVIALMTNLRVCMSVSFLMLYGLLTSYSWLKDLCILFLRMVICWSLSDLIWVCMIPNRWNISCRRPPLFSAQHCLLSASLYAL